MADIRVGYVAFDPAYVGVNVGWVQFDPLADVDVRVGWLQFDPLASIPAAATPRRGPLLNTVGRLMN